MFEITEKHIAAFEGIYQYITKKVADLKDIFLNQVVLRGSDDDVALYSWPSRDSGDMPSANMLLQDSILIVHSKTFF